MQEACLVHFGAAHAVEDHCKISLLYILKLQGNRTAQHRIGVNAYAGCAATGGYQRNIAVNNFAVFIGGLDPVIIISL